jgi:hypothetical protein
MAVQKRLIGRAGRGVVMDIGPFDFRPKSLGGRVVDHQQQTLGQGQGPQDQEHQLCCDRIGLASDRRKEIIVVLKAVADAGGSKPSGDGAPTAGEQDAQQQHGQSPTIAGVQPGAQPLAPLVPLIWSFPTTFRIGHPWLLRCAACLETAA